LRAVFLFKPVSGYRVTLIGVVISALVASIVMRPLVSCETQYSTAPATASLHVVMDAPLLDD
jgi:uncharacterized membrane protein YdjX (TVP38/TMEM64 family)